MKRLFVLIGLTCLVLGPAFAADRYVAPGGGNTPPYENWGTASTDLKAAVDLANTADAGETVWVSNGTYVVTETVSVENTVVRGLSGAPGDVIVDGGGSVMCFHLKNSSSAVDGLSVSNGYGFAGGGAFVKLGTLRDCVFVDNRTVADYRGGGAGAYCVGDEVLVSNCVFSGNSASNIYNPFGEGGGVKLLGGLVVDCVFTNNDSYNRGGGASVWGGVVSNCTFVENGNLGISGGGVYVLTGVVANCVLSGNSANNGGAVRLDSGSAVLMTSTCMWNYSYNGGAVYSMDGLVSGCTIENNTAISGGGGGGGVYMLGRATVVDSTINSNSALRTGADHFGGGGILSGTSDGLIDNCVITSNYTPVNAYGAGIHFNKGGRGLVVSNCTIAANTAGSSGGGLYAYNNGATGLRIYGSTFSGNTALKGAGLFMYMAGTAQTCRVIGNTARTYYGGGAALSGGATLISCLVADNAATNNNFGGGGISTFGLSSLINCTIVSNLVTEKNVASYGGGVYCAAASTGLVMNCIVVSNRSPSDATHDNWYLKDVTAVMVASNTCTTPSVAAYGAGNITDPPLFVDAADGDYRLVKGSPCIDTGLTETWMSGTLDLDGSRRVLGDAVDMGAYEWIPPPGGTVVLLR